MIVVSTRNGQEDQEGWPKLLVTPATLFITPRLEHLRVVVVFVTVKLRSLRLRSITTRSAVVATVSSAVVTTVTVTAWSTTVTAVSTSAVIAAVTVSGWSRSALRLDISLRFLHQGTTAKTHLAGLCVDF